MRNGLARQLWPDASLAVLVAGAAVLVDAVVDLVGLSAGTALFPR